MSAWLFSDFFFCFVFCFAPRLLFSSFGLSSFPSALLSFLLIFNPIFSALSFPLIPNPIFSPLPYLLLSPPIPCPSLSFLLPAPPPPLPRLSLLLSPTNVLAPPALSRHTHTPTLRGSPVCQRARGESARSPGFLVSSNLCVRLLLRRSCVFGLLAVWSVPEQFERPLFSLVCPEGTSGFALFATRSLAHHMARCLTVSNSRGALTLLCLLSRGEPFVLNFRLALLSVGAGEILRLGWRDPSRALR